MGVFKQRCIRLHGLKLKRLLEAVYERDGGCCVVCGRWVDPDVKQHHEPPKGVGGQDVMSNLVTLCPDCHYERHHGKNGRAVKEKCLAYLGRYYEF